MKLTCILVVLAIAGAYADGLQMMVNVQPTDIKHYRHCVSIRNNNNHMCSGSLISGRHVLTSGHCLKLIEENDLSVKVVVGTTYLNQGGEAYDIAKIVIHPSYGQDIEGRTDNDIGVITLDRLVQSRIVRSVHLPWRTILTGDSFTVVGWGSRDLSQPVHNDLQKMTAQSVGSNVCQQYLGNMQVYRSEFCTVIVQGTGMCHGDSGSGVVDASGTTLVGMVSGGVPCARGSSNVFTNVRYHATWIEQNMY